MTFAKWVITLTALLALAATGCNKQGQEQKQEASKAAPAKAEAPAPAETPKKVEPPKAEAPKVAPKLDKAPEGHAEPAGCAGSATAPPASEPVVTKTPAGLTLIQAGDKLAEMPVVGITELLATPDKYDGQVIEVKGDVSGMCYHGRSWFSVAAADGSGAQVRVTTMPKFKVPREAVGMAVRVQGKVEVIGVDPKFAKHLAEGHGMPAPAAADKPVKRVILRVAGAEFAEPFQK